MSDIFEEVEDSLRQDKATELWSRFGPIVWAVGLLIIGAVAWREWSVIQADQATQTRIEAFEAARDQLAEGSYGEAQDGLRALMDGESALSPLAAQFLAKTVYEGNGDAAGAADVLGAVADMEGPVERLSLLKAAYLRADTLDIAALEASLGTLPAEPTALGALALELIAARALKDGDLARARREFSYLRFAPNAPPGVIQRAEVALSIIPVAGATDETGTPSETIPLETDPAPADQGDEQ